MPSKADPMVIRGACHHDCPDTCAWEVTVEGGVATKLRGTEDHPITQGQLCPKVNRLLERVYAPDRLTTPLRRVGPKGSAEFEPISWDEAIELVADELSTVRDRSGAEAIMPYSFAGTQGKIQMGIVADRFFDLLGATEVNSHLCGVTAALGAAHVLGIPYGMDPEDLRHSKTIVLWGTNTLLTNRHLWSTIETARAAGATVICIDPIRTLTAQRSDVFIQPKPGTDVALVLGLTSALINADLIDEDWLAESTTGWAELRESAASMPVEWAAEITGVGAERIEWLARTFATETPSAVRSLIGPEHRYDGEQIMRAIAMLPAITGAWRDVGGGLARSTHIYFDAALNLPAKVNPGRRQFNMAALGDTLLDDSLDPLIEALVVHNCNPAVICPDQSRVIAGLEREDLFTIVIEQFTTDTARYADVVLPATTQVEHWDLMDAWGHLYLTLNRPAVDPVGDALPNTDIFRRLAEALDLHDPMFTKTDEQLIRELLNSDHEWLEGITFESLDEADWQRLNIAPGTRPGIDRPLANADGRFALGPLTHVEQPIRPGVRFDDYPLTLMSRKQHTKFLNSSYGGSDAHIPPDGQPRLCIHKQDAEARGIRNGEMVRVFNERGSLSVSVKIADEVQPGLVTIPFGWFNKHTPEDRSVNALTNPWVREDGIGSAAFHDTRVQVERV